MRPQQETYYFPSVTYLIRSEAPAVHSVWVNGNRIEKFSTLKLAQESVFNNIHDRTRNELGEARVKIAQCEAIQLTLGNDPSQLKWYLVKHDD